MPKNALEIISSQQGSRSTDEIVRHWIVVIAELCGKDVTPALVVLWCQLLADIEPDLLNHALEETAKTCTRFFPTPGEVRAQIDQTESNALHLEAEHAWGRVLRYVNLGSALGSLTPREKDAAQNVPGGLDWIANCSLEKLQWAKKDFVERYKLVHETGQDQYLLPEGEAKRIIARLSAGLDQPARKALSRTLELSAPTPPEPMAPDDPIRVEFGALREKLGKPTPQPEALGMEELERRRQVMIARFRRHLQERPELLFDRSEEQSSVLECAR